jgi:hypothetical protein
VCVCARVVHAAGRPLSRSALTPESKWFPRLKSPEEMRTLPLTFERKMTLKWPQRMGVGTVLQAVDLHDIDTGEVNSSPHPPERPFAVQTGQ